MTLSESSCSFSIPKPIKQTIPGTHGHDLCFRAYLNDSRLCIVKCIQEYITRTKPLRRDETQLLISFVKPHIRQFLKTPLAGGLRLFWQMLVLMRASLVLTAHAQLQLLLQKTVVLIWQPLWKLLDGQMPPLLHCFITNQYNKVLQLTLVRLFCLMLSRYSCLPLLAVALPPIDSMSIRVVVLLLFLVITLL